MVEVVSFSQSRGLHTSPVNKILFQLLRAVLKVIIKDYAVGKRDYEYLFPANGRNKLMSRQRVCQILNKAADQFELKDNIGCHTLRKTFGYWVYLVINPYQKRICRIRNILKRSSMNIRNLKFQS